VFEACCGELADEVGDAAVEADGAAAALVEFTEVPTDEADGAVTFIRDGCGETAVAMGVPGGTDTKPLPPGSTDMFTPCGRPTIPKGGRGRIG